MKILSFSQNINKNSSKFYFLLPYRGKINQNLTFGQLIKTNIIIHLEPSGGHFRKSFDEHFLLARIFLAIFHIIYIICPPGVLLWTYVFSHLSSFDTKLVGHATHNMSLKISVFTLPQLTVGALTYTCIQFCTYILEKSITSLFTQQCMYSISELNYY